MTTLSQMVREFQVALQAPADWRKTYWRAHETNTEHQERVDGAENLANKYYADAVRGPLADFRAVTTSAVKLFGHGSEAHCAAVDLATRTYDDQTKEARALFEFTAEEIMRDGECSEATSFKWDALTTLEAVRSVMEAAE